MKKRNPKALSTQHVRKRVTGLALAALFGLALGLSAPPVAAEEQPAPAVCQEARETWVAGQLHAAAEAADRCVEAAPVPFEHWFLKARILASLQDYDRAMSALEEAISRAPGNNDLYAWHVRLLAWNGNLKEAWTRYQMLPEFALDDPEIERLGADLAYWRENMPEALRRYTAYLEKHPNDRETRRKRAIVLLRQGNTKGATQDFKELCNTQPEGGNACLQLHELQRDRQRFSLEVRPEYQLRNSSTFGYDLYGRFAGSPTDRFEFFADVDYRTREYVTGTESDVYARMGGNFALGKYLTLQVAGGFTIEPLFSPEWTAEAELGYSWGKGLTTYLKYWHISFVDRNAEVVTPRVTWYLGKFMLDARYYLTVDERSVPGSSALGIAHWFVGPFDLRAGAGGGERSDYLEVNYGEIDTFWLALAGTAWDITPAHRVQFDYIYRNEASGERSVSMHQFGLGYRVAF